MRDHERINPGHSGTRSLLRIIGPSVLVIGLMFMVVGLGSFFSSFGTFEPPRYFWCCLVGMPMIAVGMAISRFAFLGAVSRYVAGEVAPVGKDTFNYMATGTKDGVRAIAGAISEGLSGRDDQPVECPKCQHANDAQAKFCDQCGGQLATAKNCRSCSTKNDGSARFCNSCGNEF